MAAESTTLFVGVQYLRDNSIINDNVDAKVLQPILRMAQAKYIQQVLGTPLYNKLITDVDNSTVTGNYQVLLEQYIIPVMVQYSVYEAIPYMNFKFRNKAISKQTSDYSIPADVSELSYMRDNVLNTAQFYAERMSVYLCSNATLFPEYNSSTEDMAPSNRNYFNGIYLTRRKHSPLKCSCGRSENNCNC